MLNRTIIFTSPILGLWSVSTVAAGAVLVRRGGIYLGSFFISFLSPSDQDSCDQVRPGPAATAILCSNLTFVFAK